MLWDARHWRAFPNGLPLKNRTNIDSVPETRIIKVKDADDRSYSIEELLEETERIPIRGCIL